MSRALAHIEEVAWVKPIPAADSIELIGVLGWQLIAKIGECPVGSKVVYVEIDSLVNKDDERFAFLESKKYRVKTMKLGKKLGSPISQGLALPISMFPEFEGMDIGTDVTEQLKITYYAGDDRQRKSKQKVNKRDKYKRMASRLAAQRPNLFNNPIIHYFIKREWGLRLLYIFFGKNKDIPRTFPEWIVKTDETRIENAPFYLESNEKWIKTEKVDGTSCTYAVDKQKSFFGKEDYEFIVCSRNVRQTDREYIPYQDFDKNVYWEMAEQYNIEEKLVQFAKENGYDRVVLQGECAGETIQKNPYKFKGRQFFAFNLVINGERVDTMQLAKFCADNGLQTVPIIDTDYVLPKTMEEMKKEADGFSVINDKVKREGFVYRTLTVPPKSFKNVSNEYILKHQ